MVKIDDIASIGKMSNKIDMGNLTSIVNMVKMVIKANIVSMVSLHGEQDWHGLHVQHGKKANMITKINTSKTVIIVNIVHKVNTIFLFFMIGYWRSEQRKTKPNYNSFTQ